MTSSDEDASGEFFNVLGATHKHVVQTVTLVGICIWVLASLLCCVCCVRKFALHEIHDHDEDTHENEMSDYPRPPKFDVEDKKRLGRRRRMRLHQYICYLIRVGWFLLGDACQALVHLVFAGVFFFFAFIMMMPSGFGGSTIALYAVGIILIVTTVLSLLRIIQVLVCMYIVEPAQGIADSGLDRINRLERRLDASMHSVEQVKHRLEEGLHHIQANAERVCDALHLHSKAAEDLGRTVRNTTHRLDESMQSVQNRAILEAAHASGRQEIHMFGTHAYHL